MFNYYKMKLIKNKITRYSRFAKSYKAAKFHKVLKSNKKILYSKIKTNVKTKIQKGGNKGDIRYDILKNFLLSRYDIVKYFSKPDKKIMLNKFDLRIILWYIWVTKIYKPENSEEIFKYLKLDYENLKKQQSKIFQMILKICDIQEFTIVLAQSSSKISASEVGKWFLSSDIKEWLNSGKIDDLIPNKYQLLELLLSYKKFFKEDDIIHDDANIEELKRELVLVFKPTHISRNNNKIFNSGIVSKRNSSRLSLKRNAKTAFLEEPHILHHMWFKDWPDHGVPDRETFIRFMQLVYLDIIQFGGTTLIHCSAGVGRTGVVYLVLKLMFDYEITDLKKLIEQHYSKISKKDIIYQLKEARKYRMNLVQTVEQLNFIMKLFNLPDSEEMTKDEFNDISIYGDENPNKNYKTREDLRTARECSNKNRYANILPYNHNRVILSGDNTCKGYINASHMPEHVFDGNNVITSQCPTNNTIDDFTKMISEYDIKRIVMVTNLVESERSKCENYTDDLDRLQAKSDISTNYVVYKDGEKILLINQKTHDSYLLHDSTRLLHSSVV